MGDRQFDFSLDQENQTAECTIDIQYFQEDSAKYFFNNLAFIKKKGIMYLSMQKNQEIVYDEYTIFTSGYYGREINEVVDTLRSGWITTGPKTKKFEEEIAEFCHTKRAVCLNSATASLELCLRILGIGPGDEVITTAYTYTPAAV